ncbi:hypothetical protein INS49_005667 [Diaporthe citri]|uniref:uncharacterized protein n=1 Tax=Diaporthe citri TaxID=83186 RepID=UPI001C7FB23E|nr:uncharacterized protein INS49_005667 [Diaporthe citri]KAG6353486.1 hypothetical protein INS49_005667 [Diaporthe citri]
MGRWGLGILRSDDNLNALASIFDSKTKEPLKEKVIRSRLRAWEEEQLKKKSEISKYGFQELEEGWERDIIPNIFHFPRLIRDYLNSGVLADLIKKHSPKTKSEAWTEDHRKLVVIAYCSMELGCTLPPGFQGLLKEKCYGPGLSPVGHNQMYRACEQYIDGKPFSFFSLDTREIEELTLREEGRGMNRALGRHVRRHRPLPPGLEPLRSQEAAAAAEKPAHERRKVEAESSPPPPVEQYFLRFPPDTCANCGATQGYGTPELRRCKSCKKTLYCFEGCQRWHWSRHNCTGE